ncbi:MAG TPA: hypothetical protein VG733_19830 [Chthoniobacteraceae bacterium]|nr:hypothetical protein [Chthoniobacteraceae bacterium]
MKNIVKLLVTATPAALIVSSGCAQGSSIAPQPVAPHGINPLGNSSSSSPVPTPSPSPVPYDPNSARPTAGFRA